MYVHHVSGISILKCRTHNPSFYCENISKEWNLLIIGFEVEWGNVSKMRSWSSTWYSRFVENFGTNLEKKLKKFRRNHTAKFFLEFFFGVAKESFFDNSCPVYYEKVKFGSKFWNNYGELECDRQSLKSTT